MISTPYGAGTSKQLFCVHSGTGYGLCLKRVGTSLPGRTDKRVAKSAKHWTQRRYGCVKDCRSGHSPSHTAIVEPGNESVDKLLRTAGGTPPGSYGHEAYEKVHLATSKN